jgi:putative toxin-antitoxin system antitoxin component (TIGR02293 family)
VRTAAKHNMLELYVDKVSRADPNGLIAMEREGVPGVLIKDLGKGFRLSQERFFRIVGAPKATIERKASSKKRVAGSVGVATLGVVRLLALARSMVARSQSPEARDFDVAAWLGTWLETPQPALGGRRPAEMLDTPTGFAVVERTLGALESGAYL